MDRLMMGLIVMLVSTAAPAADWADETDYPELAESKKIRADVRHVRIPVHNRPDRRAELGLKDCESESLYYGVGIPADPKAAFARASADSDDYGLSGEVMLMLMSIYASGKGVNGNLTKLWLWLAWSAGRPWKSIIG